MAAIADQPSGVLRGCHLRKSLGLRRVLLVTARAEDSHIRQRRFTAPRIVRVSGLRTMARLAGNMRVPARRARFGLIVVTQDALRLPREGEWTRANHIQRRRTIMAVLAEGLRNHRVPNQQKDH